MNILITLLAACLILAAGALGDDVPVFQWSNRPELTAEQQQLLRLYNDMDDSTDPAEQARLADSIKQLAAKLRANAVRPAKPGEITVTRLGETDNFAVHNPSKESVAVTIAVKGDEQPIGTRMGSIGRFTYLPPSGHAHCPEALLDDTTNRSQMTATPNITRAKNLRLSLGFRALGRFTRS